jgi:hypothetical protein
LSFSFKAPKLFLHKRGRLLSFGPVVCLSKTQATSFIGRKVLEQKTSFFYKAKIGKEDIQTQKY